MPTVNEVVGGMLENAIKNPRSTISGLLTASIGVIPILLTGNIIHGKAAIIAGSILTLSKAVWAAFFQTDPKPKTPIL